VCRRRLTVSFMSKTSSKRARKRKQMRRKLIKQRNRKIMKCCALHVHQNLQPLWVHYFCWRKVHGKQPKAVFIKSTQRQKRHENVEDFSAGTAFFWQHIRGWKSTSTAPLAEKELAKKPFIMTAFADHSHRTNQFHRSRNAHIESIHSSCLKFTKKN